MKNYDNQRMEMMKNYDNIDMSIKQKDRRKIEKILIALSQLKDKSEVNRNTLRKQMNVRHSTVKKAIKFFMFHNLIKKGRHGYRKTDKFNVFYRLYKEEYSEIFTRKFAEYPEIFTKKFKDGIKYDIKIIGDYINVSLSDAEYADIEKKIQQRVASERLWSVKKYSAFNRLFYALLCLGYEKIVTSRKLQEEANIGAREMRSALKILITHKLIASCHLGYYKTDKFKIFVKKFKLERGVNT